MATRNAALQERAVAVVVMERGACCQKLRPPSPPPSTLPLYQRPHAADVTDFALRFFSEHPPSTFVFFCFARLNLQLLRPI